MTRHYITVLAVTAIAVAAMVFAFIVISAIVRPSGDPDPVAETTTATTVPEPTTAPEGVGGDLPPEPTDVGVVRPDGSVGVLPQQFENELDAAQRRLDEYGPDPTDYERCSALLGAECSYGQYMDFLEMKAGLKEGIDRVYEGMEE